MNKFYIQILIGASRTLNLYATLGYSNLQICSVFAEYDLFRTLIHIPYRDGYNFDTVLHQILETETSHGGLSQWGRTYRPSIRPGTVKSLNLPWELS